jgi:hypothetical protein
MQAWCPENWDSPQLTHILKGDDFMKIAFLPISILISIIAISSDIYAQKNDSDQEMTPREQADFLDTMFPLAKQNGIDMNIVRVDSQDNNIVRNDFVATFKDGRKTLEQVISHPETATAIQLFVATDMTYRSGNLHEAGFLFHAGCVRLYHDLEKYPPRESDAGNTKWFLNVLENSVRIDLVRNLYSHPKILVEVVKQLEAWNMKEQPGYKPGWEYTPKDVPADLFAALKAEVLEGLKPLSVLLNIPEYFEAVSTMRECNELPLDQQEDKAVAQRRSKAEDVMRRIEKEQNLRGIIYQSVDHPAE